MILRDTFSVNTQIKNKIRLIRTHALISLNCTDTKFKRSLSDRGSDKEPLSNAICDENLTCSALERSMQKDNLTCSLHHNGI